MRLFICFRFEFSFRFISFLDLLFGFLLYFPRFLSFRVIMFVFYFLLLLFDAFVVRKCFVDGIKILSDFFSHLYDTQKNQI